MVWAFRLACQSGNPSLRHIKMNLSVTQPLTKSHPFRPITRNLYNAGLFYAGYGFNFSLAANFIDRNLAAAGSAPQTDQYYDKHFALDLSVSYEFHSGLAIYFHAKNLTDTPFRVYEGTQTAPSSANITARPTRLECSGNISEAKSSGALPRLRGRGEQGNKTSLKVYTIYALWRTR